MESRRVDSGRDRFNEDLNSLETRQLVAIDAETAVAEEKIVLRELRPHLSNEENRIAVLGITKLHERRRGPFAAVEGKRPPKRVKALRRQFRQAIRPGEAAKRDARTVKVPAVEHVVIRDQDDRKPRVGAIAEVDEPPGAHPRFVAAQGLGRLVATAFSPLTLPPPHRAPPAPLTLP